MKKFLILFACLPVLWSCEQVDTRTQAANIIYNACIKSGESTQWCRCLRADLLDAKKAVPKEIASYVVNGRQHPWLGQTILGARLRCECRIHPLKVADHGFSCASVKPIKY